MSIKDIRTSAKTRAKKVAIFAKLTSKKIWAFIKSACIFMKNWIVSHKKPTVIVASSLSIVVIVSILIVNHIHNVELSKQGYYNILSQLKEDTYSDPVEGELVVNRAGWIVNMQPIATAEEAVKKLAEADKNHNIQLFVGYNVDTNDKIITYAFVSIDENDERYTIFASQDTNGKTLFEQADYSEIDKIFATVAEE